MTETERLRLLAHELRSPVAALVALAAAAPGSSNPLERRRLLELAIAGGRDVERLVSDPELLSIHRELVDVELLLDGLVRPGVAVGVGGRPCVEGDPVRLRQALANLIANGLRHAGTVRVDAIDAGDTVSIDIHDDGPGIEEGLDVFGRAVSGVGSSGYGLWLARAIVVAHGGTLEHVRDDAPGACFRLVLPSASVVR